MDANYVYELIDLKTKQLVQVLKSNQEDIVWNEKRIIERQNENEEIKRKLSDLKKCCIDN